MFRECGTGSYDSMVGVGVRLERPDAFSGEGLLLDAYFEYSKAC